VLEHLEYTGNNFKASQLHWLMVVGTHSILTANIQYLEEVHQN